MKHLQPYLFFLVTAVLFAPLCLFAQKLPLAQLLQVYKLDSTAARQFCTGKKFTLTAAKNTGSASRYQYAAGDSSHTRLEINYPNDSASLNVQLSYWFVSAKEYNSFKKAFKKNGFTQTAAKQVPGSVPANVARYTGNNLQAELINPGGKQPYWLFLHPVGDYTW